MKNLYFSLLMLSLLNIDSLSQLDHAVEQNFSHSPLSGHPPIKRLKLKTLRLESEYVKYEYPLRIHTLIAGHLKRGLKAIVTNLHLYRLMKGKNITSHIVRREIPLQWLLKFGS